MRSRFASRHSMLFGFFVLGAVACGNAGDKSQPPDPRTPQLVGTGTADALIFDSPADEPIAKSYEVRWWEVELQVEGDTIPESSGVITPSDATKVSIAFWGHRADGSTTVTGHFAVDLSQWLGLEQEHDAVDIAMIFSGSEARFHNAGPLDDEEATAVFNSVFKAIESGIAGIPGAAEKSLQPSLNKKGGGLGALLTCVGDKKAALKDALTSLTSKFKSCASCAAKTIFGETSPEAWKACGTTCASSIMDAKGTEPLMDLLKCKNVLSVPEASDDSVVSRPEGMTDGGTCWSKSSDKVHGTYRMTDGKGAVSCGDCPSGMVPSESTIGCAPAGDVDDSKAIVQIPAGDNTPAAPKVITKDACLTVDVTTTGTINKNPVDPTPRRVNYRVGNRPWDQLPKVSNASSDQVDLTSNQHQGTSEGTFEVSGESKSSRATRPDNGDTVEAAINRGGCSSDVVLGLSSQIAEEMARCVLPGKLVKVTGNRNLNVSRVPHPYLEQPAAEALVRAAAAGGGARMSINHMFRTVAQQYVISRMGSRCGIKKWARPGNSNHESGIAIDINSYSSWRTHLEAQGFRWLGSGDPVHFDYKGAGSEDLRGNDVKAFQRLWNRNHPEDVIAEDGVYGSDTETRLKKSPAGGFPKGPSAGCSIPEVKTGTGSKEPMKYVTNVTTAEYYPGQGCTTGTDASHSDGVDACVKSEAVCESYWCDLADFRDAACTGSTVKPAVAPTSAPPAKPACKELGEFQLTYYYIAQERDFSGMAAEPMYSRSGMLLAMAPTAFVKAARMNGTGKTSSGKALNWVGTCPHSPYGCFQQLGSEYPNGVGKAGRNLDYYQSIAVDPTVIALGTRVYAKELDGMTMPDGTVHDGWLLADDTGGRILGKHIDFFVEGKAAYRELDSKTRMTHVTLSPEKCDTESGS